MRDHPRRCGENAILRRPIGVTRGSPPQVRGKPIRIFPCPAATGITPAGAGKTISSFFPAQAYEDHPRRCGENCRCLLRALSKAGSPPQVRGKLRYNLANVIQIRITPAGAGKTLRKACYAVAHKDHPRRCGENCHRVNFRFPLAGSPPQVRGKPRRHTIKCSNIRITPAGAGKT